LCNPIAVADINPYQTTLISFALYPSGKGYGFAGVFYCKFSAGVRSVHVVLFFEMRRRNYKKATIALR
jgi:hypothetical protein